MKPAIFSLMVYLILLGCEKEPGITDSPNSDSPNNIISDTTIHDITDYTLSSVRFVSDSEFFGSKGCFGFFEYNADSGFVIRDSISYSELADSLRYKGPDEQCDSATLGNVDFRKFSLIGITTDYGACDSISRKIELDTTNKTIFYTIDIIRSDQNPCILILFRQLNLILVPKLPDDYEVDFTVNRK